MSKLAQLARAATPGPWSLDPMFGLVVADGVVVAETRDFPRCDNARLIAAANPQTVLLMIEALKAAEDMRSWYRKQNARILDFSYGPASRFDAAMAKLEHLL